MAYRFTKTDKWKDLWFRKLPVESKVLFEYIRDNCDIAGFWEIDFELASFDTGLPLSSAMVGVFENIKPQLSTIEGALKGLERCYLKEGNIIWIKTFLLHQKNLPLNPENKCHQGILSLIRSRNSFGEQVLKEITKQITEKGLCSPSGNGIGKDKGNSIFFDFQNFLFTGITNEDKKAWSEAYPAVDIELDIKRAAEWLKSNPTKKKSRYRRFLTNWFSRTQDKGGNKNARSSKGGFSSGRSRDEYR